MCVYEKKKTKLLMIFNGQEEFNSQFLLLLLFKSNVIATTVAVTFDF